MPDTLFSPVLRALSSATGVDIHQLDEPGIARMPELTVTNTLKVGQVMVVASDRGRLIVTRYGQPPLAVIVAGPFGHPEDSFRDVPLLDSLSEGRLKQALNEATAALSRIDEERRRRLELSSQLEFISSAVIAIATGLDLEPMLLRIVDLAQNITGARFAALALPDSKGEIETFVSQGIDPELTQRIGNHPRGLGILGVLLRDSRPIRTMDLTTHPASIGFPANHPHMTSFLGVPIVVRDSVLGSIYLADTRFGPAFTEEGTRLVQILARHAGVAIEHARMFQEVSSYERRLREICDQMPAAIVIAESSPDRVTLANRKASHLLGWDIQPPLSLESFFSHNKWRFTDGTPMPHELTPLRRAIGNGEPVPQFTCDLTLPDGRTAALMVNAAPLNDGDYHITGAIMTFQEASNLGDAHPRGDALSAFFDSGERDAAPQEPAHL